MTAAERDRGDAPISIAMPSPLHIGEEIPDGRALEAINEVIAAAIDNWRLSERVKRAALPSYRYDTFDQADTRFFLARDETGAIQGVATLGPINRGEGLPGTPSRLLHGLFVAPAATGRGIGTRLLATVEAAARAEGAGALVVRAHVEATGFFEAAGYGPHESAVFPHAMVKRFPPTG